MVIVLAVVGRTLVIVHAAHAAAVEIAQASGVFHRLPKRTRLGQRLHRFADIAPEQAEAHADRNERIEKGNAEQQRHHIVRHQPIEGAGRRIGGEQRGRLVRQDKADDEEGDASRGDEADLQRIAVEQPGKGARPRIGLVGLRTYTRKRAWNVDVEFVRGRELAVIVACAA